MLAPPAACDALDVRADRDDPSFRQSRVDWADRAARVRHGFASAAALETVVRAGEVLYVPSYWFHYIVSLSQSAQCNTRSGRSPDRRGAETIRRCLARQDDRATPTPRPGEAVD